MLHAVGGCLDKGPFETRRLPVLSLLSEVSLVAPAGSAGPVTWPSRSGQFILSCNVARVPKPSVCSRSWEMGERGWAVTGAVGEPTYLGATYYHVCEWERC